MRLLYQTIGSFLTFAATPAVGHDEIVTGTYIRTCTNTPAEADYGPVERVHGVYFSFIDGAHFTPCVVESQCNSDSATRPFDVRSLQGAWDHLEDGYAGWGYYRLTFEGRRGRWRPPHPCIGERQEFYEIRRVLSVMKLPDR